MRVSPEQRKSGSVGRVWVDGATVCAKYPEKDETWRVTCKRLLYGWEVNRWQRTFAAGVDVTARAAELVHRLLLAGFVVDAPESIMQMALAANYTPETFRHVRRYVAGEYADWFCLSWARNEDLYGMTTRLPGAHWDGRAVVVSREHFEEVLDFAEHHGFEVSQAALALAEMARDERDRMVILPIPPLPKTPPASMKRPELPAPAFVDVDRELLDDEYNDDVA